MSFSDRIGRAARRAARVSGCRILSLPVPAVALLCCCCAGTAASAQISFTSAVGLALSSSPRVRMAQADLDKARASLAEAHDVYLPEVSGIMDLGYSYGAPLGEPTLFSFSAHSRVFSYQQKDYIRAGISGLAAANSLLEEAREEVGEDAAVTYVTLDSDEQRRATLVEEYGHANQLARIIQDRLDLGQDTQLELLQARRTAAQIRLQMLQLDDEITSCRSHLAQLDGLPDGPMATEPSSVPALPEVPPPSSTIDRTLTLSAAPSGSLEPPADTPGVAAAFANARAKQQQAFGDSRYLYRPQVDFFAQYSRFSTFNNYGTYYPAFNVNTLNAIGIGVQITVPFYDRLHQDRAEESRADARRAEQEALNARNQMFEGRTKLQHASSELAAQAELANYDQQIAQQQLAAILTQLQAGTGDAAGPQLTPKDEQKARIQERQHYLDYLSARSNLRQAQIRLLRLTGQLEQWLRSAAAAPSPNLPAAPGPAPR
jgi:outer membrane protein TolC